MAEKVAKKKSSKAKKVGPYALGMQIFIRTVTFIQIGRLVEVHQQELVLEDACWVADTGRFTEALETGKLIEVEPFPNGRVVVGRGAIVDACEWTHEMPRKVLPE